MKKYILDFKVLSNQAINYNHNLLELSCDRPLPPMQPGQFAEVRVDGSPGTYLRRPFSIHRADFAMNTMHLLIKSIGEGTRKLAQLEAGSTVNIMLPLGNGFPVTENSDVLLVGGGCGVAPLWFLARLLKQKGNKVSILIGGRSYRDILLAEDYAQFGQVYVSTEDGSLGEKGMVLLFTFYFLLFTFYFLLFTFYFLLFTFYFLLFTFYFLLFTFYFLLFFTFYFQPPHGQSIR
ncbi:MAG: hypothetical protein IPF68_18580 [Bacteroidales bacterium]|nr:hypothetical protein [Bacteroidales bacterium]